MWSQIKISVMYNPPEPETSRDSPVDARGRDGRNSGSNAPSLFPARCSTSYNLVSQESGTTWFARYVP